MCVRLGVSVCACMRVRVHVSAHVQSSTKYVYMDISCRARPTLGTTKTTLIDNICLLEKMNSKRQTYGSYGTTLSLATKCPYHRHRAIKGQSSREPCLTSDVEFNENTDLFPQKSWKLFFRFSMLNLKSADYTMRN